MRRNSPRFEFKASCGFTRSFEASSRRREEHVVERRISNDARQNRLWTTTSSTKRRPASRETWARAVAEKCAVVALIACVTIVARDGNARDVGFARGG